MLAMCVAACRHACHGKVLKVDSKRHAHLQNAFPKVPKVTALPTVVAAAADPQTSSSSQVKNRAARGLDVQVQTPTRPDLQGRCLRICSQMQSM